METTSTFVMRLIILADGLTSWFCQVAAHFISSTAQSNPPSSDDGLLLERERERESNIYIRRLLGFSFASFVIPYARLADDRLAG